MLHDYVNLYFDAHNPMLSKCRCYNNDICVLRINKTVLALDGVIIADRNAAGSYVRFGPFPDGLDNIDKDRVFARFWLHADDIFDEWLHKSEKCAEVLVPGSVDSQYIVGAYVANPEARKQFQELNSSLTVQQKNDMFF